MNTTSETVFDNLKRLVINENLLKNKGEYETAKIIVFSSYIGLGENRRIEMINIFKEKHDETLKKLSNNCEMIETDAEKESKIINKCEKIVDDFESKLEQQMM